MAHFFVFLQLDFEQKSNSLLYDLIQAKETFEPDHAYKLEISISPLNEFKTVRIKRDNIKLPSDSSLGIVILFLYGATLDFEATREVEMKWLLHISNRDNTHKPSPKHP